MLFKLKKSYTPAYPHVKMCVLHSYTTQSFVFTESFDIDSLKKSHTVQYHRPLLFHYEFWG